MESKLDVLQVQMAQLQQAIASLRRQRWGVLLLLVMVIVVFATSSATTQTPPQDLICKSLKVMGNDGKPRVTIEADRDGGIVYIFSNDGKPQVRIAVNKHFGYRLSIGNGFKVQSTPVGGGGIEVYDNEGRVTGRLPETVQSVTIDWSWPNPGTR